MPEAIAQPTYNAPFQKQPSRPAKIAPAGRGWVKPAMGSQPLSRDVIQKSLPVKKLSPRAGLSLSPEEIRQNPNGDQFKKFTEAFAAMPWNFKNSIDPYSHH